MKQKSTKGTERRETAAAMLPANYQLNLSDFALFMSVMKVKKAYKVFLNMTSKNGRPELVSLLQYMKNTTLDNEDIVVKDERILDLNRIVEEVKQSEEWEVVEMGILEIGLARGIEQGRELGIEQGRELGIKQSLRTVVENMLRHNLPDEDIMMYTECEQEFIDKVRHEMNAV